ncbi:MAG: VCBS repeat-containing protein [Polyangiaceae bacterium]|nr:VCBS repeat-containing protein [Polyangiaceae bacterium]
MMEHDRRWTTLIGAVLCSAAIGAVTACGGREQRYEWSPARAGSVGASGAQGEAGSAGNGEHHPEGGSPGRAGAGNAGQRTTHSGGGSGIIAGAAGEAASGTGGAAAGGDASGDIAGAAGDASDTGGSGGARPGVAGSAGVAGAAATIGGMAGALPAAGGSAGAAGAGTGGQTGGSSGAGGAFECEDTVDCAPFEDEDVCNGTLHCVSHACEINPATVVVCDTSDDSVCGENRCNPSDGHCSIVPLRGNTDSCDDGDDCTEDDACSDGLCVGMPVVPAVPTPTWPPNGSYTGSLHAGEVALRPELVWRPRAEACPATSYDVVVADTCTVTGFSTCALPSPAAQGVGITATRWRPSASLPVSTLQPVGRRYFWRVRGCRETSCSSWSPVRYLDVGRVPSDFNGDGYSDVVVADADGWWNSGQGAVFIYPGGPSGPAADPSRTLTSAEKGFGIGLATPDLDANGYSELVVATNSTTNPTVLYKGHSTGIETTGAYVRTLGFAAIRLADAGDLNGDGLPDLAAASNVWFDASGIGGASILYGSLTDYAAGQGTDLTLPRPAPCDGAGTYCEFGTDLNAVGDLNLDGLADLVIGAPYSPGVPGGGKGRAYVYLGSEINFGAVPDELVEVAGATNFGTNAHGAGDFNGDGISDWVACDQKYDPFSLYFYYGPHAAAQPEPSLTREGSATSFAVDYRRALTALPLGGGTWATLAMASVSSSSITVSTLAGTTSISNPDPVLYTAFPTFVAAVGDVNGDGAGDAAVGAEVTGGVGAVVLLLGSTSAATLSASTRLLPSGTGYNEFGTTIADSRW